MFQHFYVDALILSLFYSWRYINGVKQKPDHGEQVMNIFLALQITTMKRHDLMRTSNFNFNCLLLKNEFGDP